MRIINGANRPRAPEVTNDNRRSPEIVGFYGGIPTVPRKDLDLPPTANDPLRANSGRALVCQILSRAGGATYAEVWDSIRDAGISSWNTADKLNHTSASNGLGMVRRHGYRLIYTAATGKYWAIKNQKTVTEQILQIAQQLADQRATFFSIKGPGAGDSDTIEFMRELRALVEVATGNDYSEKRICGDNALAVDFFVPAEETVVEVALSLRNPNCEFERDILKVLMAQEAGVHVTKLVFLAKPGGVKRLAQPSAKAMVAWAARNHNLEIVARDLTAPFVTMEPLEPGVGCEA